MDAAQVHETTIFKRERAGEGFRFVTVPARSVPGSKPPQLESAARVLGLEQPRGRRSQLVEPWILPFVIDAALTADADFPYYLRRLLRLPGDDCPESPGEHER